MSTRRTEIVSAAIPSALAQRLRQEAAREDRALSVVIRRVLTAWASWQPPAGD